MTIAPNPLLSTSVRGMLVLVLLTSGLRCTVSTAHDLSNAFPLVTAASLPIYPPDARVARVEGIVRLRVSTDGRRVSAISVESGPAMLVPATEENVRTWLFKEHTPTTFETTFRYKMLPESECVMDNDTASLSLPNEVELSAKGVKTCDPKEIVR